MVASHFARKGSLGAWFPRLVAIVCQDGRGPWGSRQIMYIIYILYTCIDMYIRSIYKTMYIYSYTYFRLHKVKKIIRQYNIYISIYIYVVLAISNYYRYYYHHYFAIPLPGRHPDHLEAIFGILRVPWLCLQELARSLTSSDQSRFPPKIYASVYAHAKRFRDTNCKYTGTMG